MNDQLNVPKKKLHLLGTLLLAVAVLVLIGAVMLGVSTLVLTQPSDYSEIDATVDAQLLPEGIRMEMTVAELLEKDHAILDEVRGPFLLLQVTMVLFMVLFAIILIGLARSWRRAEPFGRVTIIGLRCLGILLIARFLLGLLVETLLPRPALSELFVNSELYVGFIEYLVSGGPMLTSGILFLILSGVLDYGRKIKDEQALTI